MAMILGSIVLVVFFDMGVEGVAISAVAGSLLHLLIQIPKFKSYYAKRFEVSLKVLKEGLRHSKTIQALRLAIPRTIGVLGEQINTVVNTLISFSLTVGALSAYRFAISLHLFPVNIIGSAVAQVALPDLAEHCDNREEYCRILNRSIQTALFLVFPIVSILIVLRLPLVRLAYGVGAFDWRATILTSWCLVLLSFSVIGQTVAQILLRAFYALKETWLPLVAILIGIVVNIVFAFLLTNFFSHYYDWRPILEQMFVQVSEANGKEFMNVFFSFLGDVIRWSTKRGDSDLAVGGLSLGLSIAYFVETVLLAFLLNLKGKFITFKRTIMPTMKKLLNAILMCVGMYFVFKLFDFQLDTTRTVSIIILTIITSMYGILSYWLGSKVFRIEEVTVVDELLDDIKDNFLRKKRKNEEVNGDF
jgi:peptidoglycan biosynthesis protein MviN/MurJ (putative lipid II flippase)